MTCNDCKQNTGSYNMKNLCCMNRHIRMMFLAPNVSRTDYAMGIAKKYGVTIDEIRSAK